jgi:glycosyltransferase involved in cell wall biosynthesis
MACGLPVVCFNEGGQVDFLEDGATGRLIKVGNVDALVAACRELARDRESRDLFGKRALARVQPYFIHQCAARYEELFRRVIASKRRMIR